MPAWGCAWFLLGGVAHGAENVLLPTSARGLLVITLGAGWTMFVAGLHPGLAGLAGFVILEKGAGVERRIRTSPSRSVVGRKGAVVGTVPVTCL